MLGNAGTDEDEKEMIRFWSKVEFSDPYSCWEWTAGKFHNGYGAFGVGKGKVETAQRVAYRIVRGEIPAGHDVHHECENRGCVNPYHLTAISKADHNAGHKALDVCARGHARTLENLSGSNCKQCYKIWAAKNLDRRAMQMRGYRAKKRSTA